MNAKNLSVYIKLINKDAILPKYATSGSVGMDLYSTDDKKIDKIGLVSTGIAMDIPKGLYGRIAPKSSLSKIGILVEGGVIDNDYRGEIKVILYNIHQTLKIEIKKGDAIAQLIFEKIEYPKLNEIKELDETVRNDGGFGSTKNTLPTLIYDQN